MCRARRSKAKKEKQALIDPHGAFRSAPSIRVSNFRVPVAAHKRNGAEAGAFRSSGVVCLAHHGPPYVRALPGVVQARKSASNRVACSRFSNLNLVPEKLLNIRE